MYLVIRLSRSGVMNQKNAAHDRYLRSGRRSDKKEFRRQQRQVKCAVDAARETWILK